MRWWRLRSRRIVDGAAFCSHCAVVEVASLGYRRKRWDVQKLDVTLETLKTFATIEQGSSIRTESGQGRRMGKKRERKSGVVSAEGMEWKRSESVEFCGATPLLQLFCAAPT